MKKTAWTLVFLSLAVRLFAQSNAPVRLALIAETGEAAAASDVLTTQLSGNPNIQLLERNEIEKIYREQGMSAANKDYLKLGRILGADGLLLLETFREGTNQFLNSRLVAVKPGVLLTSVRFPWPLEDAMHWAAGFVNHLNPLMPKLTVLARDAVPISIMNLRSAVQSQEGRELERQLTLLAIERLSRERQMFVLERRRMQFLSVEKELAGMDESAFWNGSYLLEGTIDRDGYNREKLTLNARLVPPNGGAPLQIEVSGSRTNFPEIINQLAGKVLENLKLSPTVLSWNPADEAKQFHEEANWALRFGLYEQAQAAIESAWALGRRTTEVGILRVRAYGEDVLSPESAFSQCNLSVPAVPDETKLRSGIRALELLCQDASRSATNPATLHPEWYDVGLRTLRVAARYLEGFYYAAEMRRGNEDQLAELRSRARQTAALLKATQPDERKIQQRSDAYWRAGGVCGSLEWLIWEEGGIWREKPEDALPGLRELLESGFHPEHLPRVIGWSWENRKGVPNLLRRFIDELCASTNSAVRLEGRYLALLRSPDTAEGDIERIEGQLFGEIWEQRQSLFGDPGMVSVLARAEEVIRDKRYDWSDRNRRLEYEPLMSLRHRIRKDYLINATNYSQWAFLMLFPNNSRDYSPQEARELLEAVQNFKERVQPQKLNAHVLTSITNVLRDLAGISGVVWKQQPITPRPAENPLEANFIEWKLQPGAFDTNRFPRLSGSVVRGGKIWCWVGYSRGYSSFDAAGRFFSADPVTGDCGEIPFPPQFDQLYTPVWFEVTEDSLFASCQSHLMRFRFRKKAWEEIPLPVEGDVRIVGLGSQLYLAAGESLLELEPDSGNVQVLASSRRRPTVNELDAVWNQTARLFARADGRLGIQITNRLFGFDPVSRGWSSIAALPAPSPRQTYVFTSGEGAQWLLLSYNAPRRLFAFWNNQTQPELLLEQLNPRAPNTTNLVQPYGQPRWNWPERFRLDYPLFVVEGQKFWMIQPRRLDWGFGGEEPIKFEDARQATLLLFEPGSQECRYVPLVFRKDGGPVNPFDSRNLSFIGIDTPIPFFLATDEGLVLACPAWAGHWLIPKPVLQSRLKPMPASQSEQSPTNAEAAAQARPNTVSAVTTNSGQTTKP